MDLRCLDTYFPGTVASQRTPGDANLEKRKLQYVADARPGRLW